MTLQAVVDGFELPDDAAMQTCNEERWRAVVKVHPDGYRVFLMRYGLADWSATHATLDGLVAALPVVAHPERWTYARRFVHGYEPGERNSHE
jgi:hypothetical protein